MSENSSDIMDIVARAYPKHGDGKPATPRGTDSAEIAVVIKTTALKGSGGEDDPCRCIVQFWDFDGTLLAENDPCAN